MKVASCSIIILENLYLKEFIEWQKEKAFSHVFIYDHNTKENPLDVLQPYVDEGFVTVIPWQGHQIGPAVMEAFQDCWDKYKDSYDWIQFCDIDEYLEFNDPEITNVDEYLSQRKFDSVDIIKINWMCFDDNDLIYYDDRPQQERFTRCCGINGDPFTFLENRHIKCIINTKAKDIDFLHGTAHCPNRFYGINKEKGIYRYDLKITNNNGTPISFKHQRRESKIKSINYDQAYFKHYRCKTIEEYCLNKINKLPFSKYKNINFNLGFFYHYNKCNNEKTEYYKNFINSLKSNGD